MARRSIPRPSPRSFVAWRINCARFMSSRISSRRGWDRYPAPATPRRPNSPKWEKAATCLEDKLLPSTSNAVERGNRRYRKMQKSIYSVRTQEQIKARIALDMWREAQGEGRDQTLHALHKARAG